ncbi:MAG: hypothetical protein QOI95_2884 [Acidimicrobiaceae bacterium]
MSEFREPVVKALFAVSGNQCAFQNVDTGAGCEEKLTDPSWRRTKGQIAHIRGRQPGSVRYEAAYAHVNEFENLLVLCPNHHTQIDDLEPHRYTTDVLVEMKARHEMSAPMPSKWIDEDDLERVAKEVTAATVARWIAENMMAQAAAEADVVESMRQALADAISSMAERPKIVLTLYYYERLTLAQIGQAIGVSASTVGRIRRGALLDLRDALGPEADALLSAIR